MRGSDRAWSVAPHRGDAPVRAACAPSRDGVTKAAARAVRRASAWAGPGRRSFSALATPRVRRALSHNSVRQPSSVCAESGKRLTPVYTPGRFFQRCPACAVTTEARRRARARTVLKNNGTTEFTIRGAGRPPWATSAPSIKAPYQRYNAMKKPGRHRARQRRRCFTTYVNEPRGRNLL